MTQNETEECISIETPHGIKHVSRKDIIHFPEGLLGFADYTDFVFFDIKGCKPFKSMLSVVEGGPDFIVVEPISIFEDYSPLDYFSSHEELGIGDPVELAVLSIITLAEEPQDSTVNLRGPLFVNLSSNLARQIVLPDDIYSSRVSLMVKK
ncbi:flagellar assembly protein FliW [Candidatus Latescibacterota bacterium]